MGVALGLGAALLWGLADYFAALASRGIGALRVVLGFQNETHAEVKDGVAVGEEVLLTAPHGDVRRASPAAPNA